MLNTQIAKASFGTGPAKATRVWQRMFSFQPGRWVSLLTCLCFYIFKMGDRGLTFRILNTEA